MNLAIGPHNWLIKRFAIIPVDYGVFKHVYTTLCWFALFSAEHWRYSESSLHIIGHFEWCHLVINMWSKLTIAIDTWETVPNLINIALPADGVVCHLQTQYRPGSDPVYIDSLRPSDAYMHQYNIPTLLQIMSCRRQAFTWNKIPPYCKYDHKESLPVIYFFVLKISRFLIKEMHLKLSFAK